MKVKKWLVALLAALLALACIGAVACSGGGEEGTKYTVTYVDITADNATLKTEEVERIEKDGKFLEVRFRSGGRKWLSRLCR